MALVVEDGTGLATANTYIGTADADTYHLDRDHAQWGAASNAAKESALIQATQWIDGRYRSRWLGNRSTLAQALAWPRYDAYDEDGFVLSGIPRRLQWATAEAALLVVMGEDLSPALERGGRVRRESVVNGLTDTEYESGAPVRTVYTRVTDLLFGLYRSGGVRVTR